MQQPIKVTYQSTSNVLTANNWLHKLPSTVACDFETAIKYTPEQLAQWEATLQENLPKLERKRIEALLSATALDHPSHTVLTHLQLAWSPSEAYVFILDNKKITDLILQFLITTSRRQIWHNAIYDFKQIYYRTGSFPQVYEDTQLLSKCILNHVETHKARTGLKELAGQWYGSWAISPDSFTVDQMYDPKVLLYAATDACATYRLWTSINDYIQEEKKAQQ